MRLTFSNLADCVRQRVARSFLDSRSWKRSAGSRRSGSYSRTGSRALSGGWSSRIQFLESRVLLAAQIIQPSQTLLPATTGESQALDINYTTDDGDNMLSALGFRLHFDSSVLQFDGLTNVFDNGFKIQEQTDGDDTVADHDNDPSTDSFILVAWADPVNDGFPGTPLPQRLYTFNFTPVDGFAGETTLNFTESATALTHDFESESVTVFVPPLTVDLVDSSLDSTDSTSQVTFEFTEEVTGFDESDVMVENGELTDFSGSGSSFSATFTAFDGVSDTGSVSVAEGSYTRPSGLTARGATDTVTIDTTGLAPGFEFSFEGIASDLHPTLRYFGSSDPNLAPFQIIRHGEVTLSSLTRFPKTLAAAGNDPANVTIEFGSDNPASLVEVISLDSFDNGLSTGTVNQTYRPDGQLAPDGTQSDDPAITLFVSGTAVAEGVFQELSLDGDMSGTILSTSTGRLQFQQAVGADTAVFDEILANTGGTGVVPVELDEFFFTGPPAGFADAEVFQSSGAAGFSVTNQAPAIASNETLIVFEEGGTGITTSVLNEGDPDDSGFGVTYAITSGPSHGTVTRNGSPATTFTQADIDAGRVAYEHDGSEEASDSFEFTLSDGGENGVQPASGTFSIEVMPVNDDPVIDTNAGVTVDEGGTVVLSTSELSTSDPDNDPSGLTYTVVTAPLAGNVLVDGSEDTSFTQAQLEAGLVSYAHDDSEATEDSFEFRVSDGEATVPDMSGDPATFEITVNPVNDPPVLAVEDQSVTSLAEDADTMARTEIASFTITDPDGGDNELRLTGTDADQFELDGNTLFLSAGATLDHESAPTLTVDVEVHDDSIDGTAAEDSETVNVTITNVNEAPSFDAGATLNVTVAENTADVTNILGLDPDDPELLQMQIVGGEDMDDFTIDDSFGNAPLTRTLSFIDPPAFVEGGDNDFTVVLSLTDDEGLTASENLTVNVTVAQFGFVAPFAATVNENQTTVIDLDAVVSPGDTAVFSIVDNGAADDGALFDIDSASGLVTFNAAPDFESPADVGGDPGDNVYVFEAQVVDQTVTEPATRQITVTVQNVDEAPVFTIEEPAHTSNEDAGLQTVTDFATGISAIEPDQTGSLDFVFTQTGGTLTFAQAPDIDPVSGDLTYEAAGDANGTATFNVTLTDSGSDTAPNSNTSSAVEVTITVNAVNDAPTFSLGDDQEVDEDAGAQTVTGFLTGAIAGPTDEQLSQMLQTPVVTSDNPSLFSVQPAIDASGALTFTPAPDANGVADLTVTLSDDGGTPNGGEDTSDEEPFSITVNAVNDAPEVAVNTGLNVREGEARTITMGQLETSDVDDGPADLDYTVTVQPTAGNLLLDGETATTFTQADINSGSLAYEHTNLEITSDSFEFTVADGGEDGAQPATGTFEINVLTILSEIPDQTFGSGLGTVTIPVAAAIIDGDVPELSATGLPEYGSFTDHGDGTGLFTFTPLPGQEGTTEGITLNAETMDGTDSVSFDATVVEGPMEISNETVQFINAAGAGFATPLISGDLGGSSSVRNTGNAFSTGASIDISDDSVPEGTPAALFQTVRWDASSGPEMRFSFPVDPGEYRVNLFFSEIYEPAFENGARVFDVSVEGEIAFDNLDVFSEVGGNAGLVKTVDVTADSTLDIEFLHQVENPAVAGIQITNRNQVPSQSPPMLQAVGNEDAPEGQTTTIDLRATDADGDDASFEVDGLPTFATFVDNGNGTGRITVNAVQDDAGEYPLTVTVTQQNGIALTDAESFVLSVEATNDPPQVDVNDPLTVDEGGTGLIDDDLLSSSDPDDDDRSLTYTIDAAPSHGTLELDGQELSTGDSFTQGDVDDGDVEYVHGGGESTSDEFGFLLADGGEDGVEPVSGTFSITIDPVNDSPSIDVSRDLSVRAGSTRKISVAQLSGSDPDDTPSGLTYTVTDGPEEGTILVGGTAPAQSPVTFTQQDLIDGLVEYRNDNDQATSDSFSVELADGGEDGATTDTATIDIAISDVTIIAPVPDQVLATQAGAVDIPVAAASVDGVTASLTASIPAEIQSFTTFTDNGDGTGLFTFDPQAGDATTSTIELTASAGDVEETFSFELTVVAGEVQSPEQPVLNRINAGGPGVADMPAWSADLGGGSAFRNTGNIFTTSAGISLADDSVPEGTPASIFQSVRWDAPSGPEMQFSFPADPGEYQVNLFFSEIYEPAFENGGRVFDVEVEGELEIDNLDVFSEVGGNAGLVKSVSTVTSDGSLDIRLLHQVENPVISAIEIIDLNPVPVQTAPVLPSIGNFTVNEGQTVVQGFTGFDAEGDDVETSITGLPAFVNVSEPDSDGVVTVTATPSEGDAGQYPINVTVTQENDPALTDSESVVLTVVGVNEPPELFQNNPLTVEEGGSGTIDAGLLIGSDPDDGSGELTFSFTMTQGPLHGQIFVDGDALSEGGSFTQADINAGLVEYRHDGGEEASDSFDFELSDGGEDGAAPVEGTFEINVTPVNDAPSLDVNVDLTVREGSTRVITSERLSGSDVDNDPSELVYTVTSAPEAGTIRVDGSPASSFTQQDINEGNVTYSQDGAFADSDSFDFSLSDGSAAPATDTFSISITAEPPFALDVNVGGPATGGFVPDDGLENGLGVDFDTDDAIDVSDVDGDIPASVFQTVLYDPDAGGEDLGFDVELEAGVTYEVTLLFSEIYGPAAGNGERVFDVSIDGEVVLDNFDIFVAAGAGNRGIARNFTVVSDGKLDIDLSHVEENPAIAGFRVREIDDAFSDPGNLPGM